MFETFDIYTAGISSDAAPVLPRPGCWCASRRSARLAASQSSTEVTAMGTRILGAVASTILVLAVVASSALAFNEPDGFRGVPWGATKDALRDKLGKASCGAYPADQRWLGDRLCTGAFPLGNVTVTAHYVFRSDKFVRVSLSFPSKDFDRMAAIFTERYGPPTVRDREILTWTGTTTAISLHRYLSGAVGGFAGITTQAEAKESKRLRDEQTKGAAKGL